MTSSTVGIRVHESRAAAEKRAVKEEFAKEAALADFADGFINLVVSKGLITAEELKLRMDIELNTFDCHPNQKFGKLGRKVIVKAWLDEHFKTELLADGLGAIKKNMKAELAEHYGEDYPEFLIGPQGPGTDLIVYEQTDADHHVIVCTLCSCWATELLGQAPSWYKSRSYRSRIQRMPRTVLEKTWGMKGLEDKAIHVHESNAQVRYMMIPQRPAGTEQWGEEKKEEFIKLITRDAMVGCGLCLTPDVVANHTFTDGHAGSVHRMKEELANGTLPTVRSVK